MKRWLILSILFAVQQEYAKCQLGGGYTYGLLLLDNTAKTSAMAGTGLSVYEEDPGLGYQNPALLDSAMAGNVQLNFMDYMAGINYGFASYAHYFGRKIGTVSATVQMLNYGKFRRFDEDEQEIGQFVAAEYVYSAGYGRAIDSVFSVGGNIKFINSILDHYHSMGIAVDLAGVYNSKKHLFTAALVVRNLGTQLKTYSGGIRSRLPAEIRLSVSKKLRHAPFRFTLGLDNLQQWDLSYVNPNDLPETDPLTGEVEEIKPPGFFHKLALHTSYGVEMILTKGFYIAGGFNYRRRSELSVETRRFLTGFSVGAGIRIKRFSIAYAHTGYHRAAGSNMITVTANIRKMR